MSQSCKRTEVIFSATPIPGVVLIEPERLVDARGSFARTYDADEFRSYGLNPAIAQCSASRNTRAGTLRGMHYQEPPHAEAKLVRCTRGAIFDVALDLRRDSPSYLRWYGVELSEETGVALFVPVGCAHGFQTLRPDSEVLYQISVPYQASAARGVRWDDPAFSIAWPEAPPGGRTLSDRDGSYPDFSP
jgi:dTDP-4-dehydrorhamnose 3,5-epimerase